METLANRKPTRLKGYDYSTPGAYFVTVCTKGKRCVLSDIVGEGLCALPVNKLTTIGNEVERCIEYIGENYPGVRIDKYVIMPNHIHMIIIIRGNIISNGMSKAPSPTNAMLSHIVSALKRFCNKEIGHNIFQRSFHDHIIRNISDYNRIAKYIYDNPLLWEQDCFYTEN